MDWLLVAGFYFISDYLIVKYYKRIILNNRLMASLISATIVGLTLISITIVVDSPWLIAAAVMGAFGGTWVGMHK
ncbi:MAG: hypothetical protein ABSG90_12870 [Dehalococcoidia bacterium]|jgi:hypothetical protein